MAAYDQGAHVTYLDPSGSQIGPQGVGARTPPGCWAGCTTAIEYRGSAQANVETLAAYAGVPVWNGLTDEWHPTQTLCDMLTMREHSPKHDEEIAFAYCGDARNNVGNSLLVAGRDDGHGRAHRRPASRCGTTDDVVEAARAIADGHRCAAHAHRGRRRRACAGVDFVYTDVWVSMGEPKEVWDERIELLRPYQVNMDLLGQDRQPERQVHALPAGVPRPRTPRSARRSTRGPGWRRSRSPTRSSSRAHSIVFDQAENRMHTIKAIMVATLGTECASWSPWAATRCSSAASP